MKSGTPLEHRGSVLLKAEENDQIFQLIGNRCLCLAAGVIQLYLTEPPLHKEWIKKNTGIITLIRDNPRRSFFLRLYCLQRKAMLWEQEVYISMDYKTPLSFFHVFEAEDCMAAFNFASEAEALALRNVLLNKLNAKRQKRQERHTKMDNAQQDTTLQRHNSSGPPLPNFNPVSSSNFQNGATTTLNVNRGKFSSTMQKKKKKDKESKRRFTKNDIGLPSNFVHISHVGWNKESKGLTYEGNGSDSIDPKLRKICRDIGLTERDLEDKNTCAFICKFVENYTDNNSAKEDNITASSSSKISTQPPALPQRQDYPPPVPARTVPQQARSVPPLPPSRQTSISSNFHQTSPGMSTAPPRSLPSRPPPPLLPSTPPSSAPTIQTSLLPPPPPPPPPMALPSKTVSNSSIPPPPPLPVFTEDSAPSNTSSNNNNNEEIDPRSMLMQSIRSGTTLRKTERVEPKPSPAEDSRSTLLEQIRKGIELKPVANEPKQPTTRLLGNDNALANALSRALAERSRAIHSESDDSTSDTSDDDDEWDD